MESTESYCVINRENMYFQKNERRGRRLTGHAKVHRAGPLDSQINKCIEAQIERLCTLRRKLF